MASSSSSLGALKSQIFDKEERKQQYQAHIRGLNAYDRHKKFLNDYVRFYGGEKSIQGNRRIRTDRDTLREGYRFIQSEEDDMDSSWEQRLAKRYYDKLFKEYCIADMAKYKNGKIGLRWRTEKEVISGKGQLICGKKHCDDTSGLASYEVNFSYFEAGENKQALVKLVTCKSNDEARQPLSKKVSLPSSRINPYRMIIILQLIILCIFLHYRITNPVKDAYALWLISVICEIWFAISWILDQFPKWFPVNRETYLDRPAIGTTEKENHHC